MKLITLQKYLNQARTSRGGVDCWMPCVAFAGSVLELMEGGPQDGEGVDLDGFRTDPALREEFFERVLRRVGQWQEERWRREEQARQEMRLLLAALNRAVMALADGGERAAGRLSAIGQTLEKASRAQSLAALGAVVYEAVGQLKRESEAQRAETVAQVEGLGRRLEEVRQRRQITLPESRGREAAILALREAEAAGGRVALAGIVFDRLSMLASRFGRAVAEEAVSACEAERISRWALAGEVYAWTPQMRVWLMDAAEDAEAVRGRLEEMLGEPFEYRTMAGGRTVTLSLEGRWMWGLLGRTSLEALIEEVDLFAAGKPIRR
ncbi:MAG: hypothetical protein ACUVS7_07890 [Bryobacteraceae bacterium]